MGADTIQMYGKGRHCSGFDIIIIATKVALGLLIHLCYLVSLGVGIECIQREHCTAEE